MAQEGGAHAYPRPIAPELVLLIHYELSGLSMLCLKHAFLCWLTS